MPQIYEAMLLGSWMSKSGGRKMGGVTGQPNQKDLAFMSELLKTGQVRSVIDKCYPFSEVPEAFRYLMAGHARGKVVITMERNNA